MRDYNGIPVVSMTKFEKETGIKISNCTGKMQGEKSITTSWTVTPMCQKNMETARKIVEKLIAEGKDPENPENKVPVCYWCYAKGGMFNVPAVRACYERNTYILDSGTPSCLPDFDARREITPVRYSTHGDLSSYTCLDTYNLIAKANPNTPFVLLTKEIELCKRYYKENVKPKNLTINVSSFFVNCEVADTIANLDWVDNVFTVYDADYAKANGIVQNCKCYTGSCKDCKRCARRNKDRYTKEILRK